MKKVIEYYYIKSDHIFAYPEYDHEEVVEVESLNDLDLYIFKQKDEFGNNFVKDISYGFNYESNQGAIKIKDYIEPIIKKI